MEKGRALVTERLERTGSKIFLNRLHEKDEENQLTVYESYR